MKETLKSKKYIIINSLEEIYKNRKMKSLEGTKIQREKISEWLLEDKSNLSLYIQMSSLSSFVASDFEIKEANLKEITQLTEWVKIDLKDCNHPLNGENGNTDNSSQSQNIILKNKIIKLAENQIMLRSLSLQCEISILMSGESTFYIFSRCEGKFSTQTTLCYISKELESARKFVSFAVLEKKEKSENQFVIRNIKKQEIPRQENYIKTLDISEIKFTFVDNGDNKCFLFLEEQEQNSNLWFTGDFYIPFNGKGNVMFGVTGDLISIKKLNIKQTTRNSYINLRNSLRGTNVQACNCCQII